MTLICCEPVRMVGSAATALRPVYSLVSLEIVGRRRAEALLLGSRILIRYSARLHLSQNRISDDHSRPLYSVTQNASLPTFSLVGGGSSGTYSAIRLSDLGKTVVVVEQHDQLGGQTQTYTDPTTGGKIDYGVVVWHGLSIVRDYFASLNASLVYRPTDNITTKYFDFTTGKLDTSYVPDAPADLIAAFSGYVNQIAKYPYVNAGLFLPSPVPSDLLYQPQTMIGFLLGFAKGMGNLLKQPTLYVMKNFGADIITDILATFAGKGFLTTALHNNHLLYANAAAVLGNNIFSNSTIVSVDRSSHNQVKILVNTTNMKVYTMLQCDTIMMTIPPKLDNLKGCDLSRFELSLFGQFMNKGCYAGFVRNSGLPNNITIFNVNPNTLYSHALLPATYKIAQTSVPGLVVAVFGANQTIPDQQGQHQILSDLKQLQVAGKGRSNPEFVIYTSHTPFELTVPTAAIAGGFYQQLYGLQGTRNTFYTGAAWHTQDSSLLWQFTEALLPNITAN
ncbi:uncharacterized protein PAC_10471 [Phialocephala subalpina]|uniref:Amine oxidase domain-containing protein n=1 Tax=Phialocephala subalpina TaxID=576137 RepID=A0A1L7X6C1_9HELO|nr:uncharacterized protein PAC_10471 [Phialocephala subalpina]